MDTAQLKKFYAESIAPALKEQFNYSSAMQIPVLKKIVINQHLEHLTSLALILTGKDNDCIIFLNM